MCQRCLCVRFLPVIQFVDWLDDHKVRVVDLFDNIDAKKPQMSVEEFQSALSSAGKKMKIHAYCFVVSSSCRLKLVSPSACLFAVLQGPMLLVRERHFGFILAGEKWFGTHLYKMFCRTVVEMGARA